MLQSGFLVDLPKELKWLIFLFLIVLSIGYFMGISFVEHTTDLNSKGIIENYNGNESNEMAETMKFKKSQHEMLNILHTHFLSLSVIFLMMGLLVYGTDLPSVIKKIIMIEPLVSVLITFGGIYLIWIGIEWVSYLVMISGILMTFCYTIGLIAILKSLVKVGPKS